MASLSSEPVGKNARSGEMRMWESLRNERRLAIDPLMFLGLSLVAIAAALSGFVAVVRGGSRSGAAQPPDRSNSTRRRFRLVIFTKKSRLLRVANETFPGASPLSLCRAIWRRIERSARAIATDGGRGGAQSLENSVPREEASCR
jgi:hypothetical protein